MKHKWLSRFVAMMIVGASVLTVSGAAFLTGETNLSSTAKNIVFDMHYGLEKKDVMYTHMDAEGNLYGPADYDIKGNSLYMLNTATNTIYEYQGDQLKRTISLERIGITGSRVSVDVDDIYVLTNQLSIKKITDQTERDIGCVADLLNVDSVVDFKVKDNYVYISEPSKAGGVTHKFEKNEEAGTLTHVKTIFGYMVDENTFYRSRILAEDGQFAGKKCIIYVLNENGQEIESVELSSENYIIGAQYLGKANNGDYIVKQFETNGISNEIEETMRRIDQNFQVVSCEIVSDLATSMPEPLKIIEGNIYQFKMNEMTAAIKKVNSDSFPAINEFESKLKSGDSSRVPYTLTATANEPQVASVGSISRAEVLDIAEMYCTDFVWSCTEDNLEALTNWTCPNYVDGPGTYSCMPYCWGGFNNIAEYNAGLSNGGRVGNIRTPATGHVANTYGLDCSGYVSRCWGQTGKYGTSTIPWVYGYLPREVLSAAQEDIKCCNQAILLGTRVFDAPNGNALGVKTEVCVRILFSEDEWVYVREYGTGESPYWVLKSELSFDFTTHIVDGIL